MMKNLLTYLLPALMLASGCQKSDSVVDTGTTQEYQPGKNLYTTTVDGDEREYFVHVPARYDNGRATPVVFMLHGTTGNGEKFYNISGWKEVGEAENILTVFPSSWKYCIVEDGKVSNTTKWNIYPGSFEYCAGEVARNDIKFLRQIIAELKQKFTVDSKRIYLAGFSNGGQMAGRCAVEMSDVFAAIAQAAGALPRNATYVPKRNLPVLFQVGNMDPFWLVGSATEIPMSSFEQIINASFKGLIQTYLNTFGLTSAYTISGDAATSLTASYGANPATPTQLFNFTLINGLGHAYPNGSNHPLKAAEVHWKWMQQFALP